MWFNSQWKPNKAEEKLIVVRYGVRCNCSCICNFMLWPGYKEQLVTLSSLCHPYLPLPYPTSVFPAAEMARSLQCPPNSCRNLVIPAESSGFRRNELWQEGLLFSSFRCLIIPAEFGHSGIETGMFRGIHRNGMQRNSGCLFV